jgi:hypothetical protein
MVTVHLVGISAKPESLHTILTRPVRRSGTVFKLDKKLFIQLSKFLPMRPTNRYYLSSPMERVSGMQYERC